MIYYYKQPKYSPQYGLEVHNSLNQYLYHSLFQDWAASVNTACQWSVDPTIADGAELVDPEQLIPVSFVSVTPANI